MNKIYNVIWSKVRHCYIVVSELAKRYNKSSVSTMFSKTLVAGVLACLFNFNFVNFAYSSVVVYPTVLSTSTFNSDYTFSNISPLDAYLDGNGYSYTGIAVNNSTGDFGLAYWSGSSNSGGAQNASQDSVSFYKVGNINGSGNGNNGSITSMTYGQFTSTHTNIDTLGTTGTSNSAGTTYDGSFIGKNTSTGAIEIFTTSFNGMINNMNDMPGYSYSVGGSGATGSGSGGIIYTAGNGITLGSDNKISAKAGNGISIDTNGISITSGSVASGNNNAITGGTAFTELRPANGTFVRQANTTAQNLTALDTAAKNAIKGLAVSGKTITYTKGDGTTGTITTQDTTYGTGTAANLTTGTDTTAKVWTSKVLADYVSDKVSAEATVRSNADTALSNRIGTLSADGNYIKQSASKNISENLSLLDTQVKTNAIAIALETTNRVNADTALSNRIGTIDADGHVVKKSATNSVSANLKAIDTKIGALAADGNYIKNEYTVMRNINSIDSKLGNGDFTDGHFVETNTTFTGNIKRLDNRLNTAVNDLSTEIQNRVTAVNAESLERSMEDTNLSNRIGVLDDEQYNYILPSSESDIASNLLVLDTTLKQTNDMVAQNKLTIENAFNDAMLDLHNTDDNIFSRLDMLEAGDVYYDNSQKSSISLQGQQGTLITNLQQGTVALGSTDAVTGHQLFQTNQNLSTEIQNRIDADTVETQARTFADTALSNRIGSVDTNGSFIKSSAIYDMAQNLQALDTALKATNDNIAGFASDIQRNKLSIRELNTSMTAALDSVATSSTLVDTVDNLKADKNLNNLTAAGRQVIASAAANAVQEYMAAQSGSNSAPMAPMMYTQPSNSLTVTDAGNGSLHVGEGSYVNGTSSIAIGVGNQVNANNSGAFGDPSIIDADASYVLGNDDRITAGATGSFIVGNDSKSEAEGSLIFGSNSESHAVDSVALGNNTKVLAQNSVAIGSHSTVSDSDTVSFGNDTLKRRITNIANGYVDENSSDAVTGSQLFSTNQRLQAAEDSLSLKANADGSNIDVQNWTDRLATGTVSENDTGLVTGGQVYSALSDVNDKISATAASILNSSLVKQDNDNTIFIGAETDGQLISIGNKDGQGRILTGVLTNPDDAYSAVNVGYVNAIGESIVASMNNAFHKVDSKMNKLGANAAAMASLTPASFEGDEKWSLSASVGSYHSETAAAVGAFYKPAENVMLNVRGAFGNGENMLGGGVAVSLSKGDVPGVTKRQLAVKVSQQAEKLNQQDVVISQQNQKLAQYEERLASYENELAELKSMVRSMNHKSD